MKNNIDFNKLKFMKNQLHNYVDYLANMKNMLDVIIEYNLILTDKELHELSQVFIDVQIFSKSLLHFNNSIEKFYYKLSERIQED